MWRILGLDDDRKTRRPEDEAPPPQWNLWITANGSVILRTTTNGAVTPHSTGYTGGTYGNGLTSGPDGNIWFTEGSAAKIGKLVY